MTSHIDSETAAGAQASTVTLQALAEAGDQSGWRVLDTARTQRFTGEMIFQTQPSITVFFDNGLAYHAVREGDPSLATQLVDSGVITHDEVERGMVRVGNVENLGRLFDRIPSVDRDAVLVVLEMGTDEVVSAVADSVSASFVMAPYRHHVSGIHRWFATPKRVAPTAPVGEIAPVVASSNEDVVIEWDEQLQPIETDPVIEFAPDPVVDDVIAPVVDSAPVLVVEEVSAPVVELPSINVTDEVPPPAFEVAPAQVADHEPDVDLPADESSAPVHSVDDDLLALLSADGGENNEAVVAPVDVTDEPFESVAHDEPVQSASPEGLSPEIEQVPEPAAALPADEFKIHWPDGSGQTLSDHGLNDIDEAPVLSHPAMAPVVESIEPIDVAETVESAELTEQAELFATIEPVEPLEPVASVAPLDDALAIVETEAPTTLSFEMPELELAAENMPKEQQPEEVVEAVRRALAAIEAASLNSAQLPAVTVGHFPSFEPSKPLEFTLVDPLAVEPRAERQPEIEIAPIESHGSALEAALSPTETSDTELPIADTYFSRADEVAPTTDEVAPTSETVAEPAAAALSPGFGAFAAPTMNDSAEAVYARAAAESEHATPGPAAGVASVVFIDEAPDDVDDRSSALKRLISGLRRK